MVGGYVRLIGVEDKAFIRTRVERILFLCLSITEINIILVTKWKGDNLSLSYDARYMKCFKALFFVRKSIFYFEKQVDWIDSNISFLYYLHFIRKRNLSGNFGSYISAIFCNRQYR